MKISPFRLLGWTVASSVLLTQGVTAQPTKTIYFIRHAESAPGLFQQGNSGNAWLPDCRPFMDGALLSECCTELLTPLGEKRAELLVKWFQDKGLLPGITHVFATHKARSLQTVTGIARAAGLNRDLNGDGIPDGADLDKNPGDGVQQLPAFADECEPGFEVAHNFYSLMVDAIQSMPSGSEAVVVGHSLSIYPIMQGLGIDTSRSSRFPKTATGAVRGLNNLWIVTLDENNAGTLVQHLQLDFAFSEKFTP